MKKIILAVYCAAISLVSLGQAPQSFQYQAVVRDVNGVALINQSVDFQISIIPGLPTNPAEYVETHTDTTNSFGIVTLSVGSGITTDNFTAINWGSAPHFIKVEADMGTGLLDMGTTQLLSVPYALYSETAGNVQTYTAGNGISIAGNVITNTAPDQTVAITGTGATSVTGTYPNFTISSTDNVNDADADATNEIQVLSISNDTMYLSNGGYVFMGNYSDTLWKKSGNSIYNTNSDNVGVGINNPVGRMVVQGSATALPTDPLFEVKNSIGQSVFVVWQDSVQVYINDDAIESNRGGFAVSGRNMSKTFTNNYLIVTPDSSRIWTKDTLKGFGVQNINGANKTSYMQLNPDNYFIGHEAGKSITTGLYNSFFGYQSGINNTSGDKNYFIGFKAGYYNNDGNCNIFIGDSAGFFNNGSTNIFIGNESGYKNTTGYRNIFIGFHAGHENINGSYNSAIGNKALYSNTTGWANVAFGANSLYFNTTGGSNTAIGDQSLYSNATGSFNTANGNKSLYSNITGQYNSSNGFEALYSNTTGWANVAFGANSLYFNTTGGSNTAIGDQSLYSNATGSFNTANGNKSLYSNITGQYNSSNGFEALYSNTTGQCNTANGNIALFYNTSGNYNTAIGKGALYSNETGWNNTALGNNAFYNGTTYSNSTALGYNADITASNQVRVGDASVNDIGGFADWTNISDIRFKNDINETVPGLAFINKLRPVTYYLNMDNIAKFLRTPDSLRLKEAEIIKGSMLQTGFIAQEVEKAALEVGFEFNGVKKPANENDYYGLRYAEFTVPLVKAVQELNSKNENLQETIDNQNIEINELKNKNIELEIRLENLENKTK